MKMPNRNQLLLLVGLVVAEGPDVAAVATWLGGLGIPHFAKLVHFLGWLSTALGSAALAWPRIRATLASAGLTTPPGALAPWNPAKDSPKIISLLDGSSVVQVAPPTQAGAPALASVAMDPSQVATNSASVTPVAPMPEPTPVTVPIKPRARVEDPSKGHVTPTMLMLLAFATLAICASAAIAFAAPVDVGQASTTQTPQLGTCLDAANTWCVQPATALGWQLNLKTGDLANAAVLLGYSLVHQAGFAIGAGLYGGVGVANNGPNAPQLNLLVSLSNFGAAGCGFQRAKFPDGVVAWQGVCGLYGTLIYGASPSYLKATAGKAAP